MDTVLFRHTLYGLSDAYLSSHPFSTTMDALITSNRSVRRARTRTNSERDRRRHNDKANYARNKNTFKTKSFRLSFRVGVCQHLTYPVYPFR